VLIAIAGAPTADLVSHVNCGSYSATRRGQLPIEAKRSAGGQRAEVETKKVSASAGGPGCSVQHPARELGGIQ